jgi:hypothetical protein
MALVRAPERVKTAGNRLIAFPPYKPSRWHPYLHRLRETVPATVWDLLIENQFKKSGYHMAASK